LLSPDDAIVDIHLQARLTNSGIVGTSRRGGKTVHIKSGYVQRHSDLLAILLLVAIVFVVGAGIYYLGESAHVHMRMRIFTGPVSTM
jgi:hypothetical protein